MITHSYIVTVLESYEYANRQIRWLAKILPANWELVFVDDGSDPPIPIPDERPENFMLIRTGDTRPWTNGLARNAAASVARGEYLLMTDIDHVFTPEAIAVANAFQGDVMRFRRQLGLLTADLRIEPDPEPVYDLNPNIFVIRKSFFEATGGYGIEGLGSSWTIDGPILAKIEEMIHNTIPQDRTAMIYTTLEEKMEFHHLDRR